MALIAKLLLFLGGCCVVGGVLTKDLLWVALGVNLTTLAVVFENGSTTSIIMLKGIEGE